MRRHLAAFLALGLLQLAPAQESIMVSHAEPLRFAFALELLGIQLDAIAMGGEPIDDDDDEEDAADAAGEDEDEVRVQPFDLLAGTLAERDPELHDQLLASLEAAADAAEREDRAALAPAVERARDRLASSERLLLTDEQRRDPAFRAAVLARLALSGSGFAESYEEAAEGEVEAYIYGWAGLQRAKEIWSELEPEVENRGSVAEVERVFAVLDDLMPTPEPSERFRDPEDAEVAAHDLVFALEAAFGGQLQPRDLGTVLELVDSEARAACDAYQQDRPRLALELLLSARINYVEGIGGTIALLVPGPAAEIRELLSESLPEKVEQGATSQVLEECARLEEAIVEAAAVFN